MPGQRLQNVHCADDSSRQSASPRCQALGILHRVDLEPSCPKPRQVRAKSCLRSLQVQWSRKYVPMLQWQPFPHANILQLQTVEMCEFRCPEIPFFLQPFRIRAACVRGNKEMIK